MIETMKIEYKKHWYQIVLWDSPNNDYLYHANIFTDNEYNNVHTTNGYPSFDSAKIAAMAIIDFMEESE